MVALTVVNILRIAFLVRVAELAPDLFSYCSTSGRACFSSRHRLRDDLVSGAMTSKALFVGGSSPSSRC
jgi:hypothetical protein